PKVLSCRVVNKGSGIPSLIIGDFVDYLLQRHRRRVKLITVLMSGPYGRRPKSAAIRIARRTTKDATGRFVAVFRSGAKFFLQPRESPKQEADGKRTGDCLQRFGSYRITRRFGNTRLRLLHLLHGRRRGLGSG